MGQTHTHSTAATQHLTSHRKANCQKNRVEHKTLLWTDEQTGQRMKEPIAQLVFKHHKNENSAGTAVIVVAPQLMQPLAQLEQAARFLGDAERCPSLFLKPSGDGAATPSPVEMSAHASGALRDIVGARLCAK